MTRSLILGTGMAVPDRIVTNDELSAVMDTTDEWITQRTGIRQRHWVREGETGVDLAERASRAAIAAAGLAGCRHRRHRAGHVDAGSLRARQRRAAAAPAWPRAHSGPRRPGSVQRLRLCAGDGRRLHQGGPVPPRAGGGPGDTVYRHGRHDARPRDGGDLRRRRRCRGARTFTPMPRAASSASTCIPTVPSPTSSGSMLPARCTTRGSAPELMAEGRHFLAMDGKEVFRHAVVRMPESVLAVLSRVGAVARRPRAAAAAPGQPAHLGDGAEDARPARRPGLQQHHVVRQHHGGDDPDRARRMRPRRTDQARATSSSAPPSAPGSCGGAWRSAGSAGQGYLAA